MLELSADGFTIALVLLSAFLHASWNALTKAGGDPLISVTVISVVGALIGLPLMIWFPLPGPDSWPWLVASAVLHYVYQLALVRTYQLGDLSQVYPIARGLAPLGVACLAVIGVGESLAPVQWLGLALASAAIISLGHARSRSRSAGPAVAMAVLTAVLIGAYTFTDGVVVRSVERPEQIIGWTFFLACVPLAVTTLVLRRSEGWTALRPVGLQAVVGGLMATIGYAIAMWALARAPMASVASLRESSVLFAAFFGTRLLGEPLGRQRVLSAFFLVVGLVLIQIRWS